MIAGLFARLLASLVTGLARLVTGVRPDWQGCLPEMRQRIYFANHGSHGDFVLIWTVLPPALRAVTRPVAGADYWDRPGPRRFIGRQVFNALMIDRNPKPDAPHPVELMAQAVKQGSSLILFPEGTRNTTEELLLPFRSGLYHLARAAPDIELVPVWIDNISRVMPKGEMLPIPLLCSVVFGAPMRLSAGEEKDAFLARARTALLALRPKEAHP
ncbi:MAG: lysophospholipid acyltransferase family protein [Hyphomicrobiales bacterium]